MTPRPKSEEKKIKIIEAAINTFAKHGLEKGTIATIAAEAGIGKGTVYQYFKSKEEIFEHIIIVVFEEMFYSWNSTIMSDKDPREKIESIIDFSIDATIQMIDADKKEQFSIIMEIFLYSFRNEGKVKIDDILQKTYKIFDPIIEEGIAKKIFKDINAKYVSFLLFSFLDGFGLHMFFQYKNYNLEEIKKNMKSILLQGILK